MLNFFTQINTVYGTLPTNLETFFRIKIFFRKNFFLSVFDKRQTIEGCGKIHPQLRYGLRRYTDEKKCIFRINFSRKIFFISVFHKRQTIEGYGKCIRNSDMVSGVIPTKRNAFFT